MQKDIEHMTEGAIETEIAYWKEQLREKMITPTGAARLEELRRALERIRNARAGRVSW